MPRRRSSLPAPCTVSTSACRCSLTNIARRLQRVREAVVRAELRPPRRQPIVAEIDERHLEEPLALPRVEPHRGRPIHASAGAISTRSPPSTRHSDTACSSPLERRRDLTRHVAELQRALLVPDRDRVGIVLVLGLGHERKTPPGIEGRVGQGLRAIRDAGDGHDAHARIRPANGLAALRVAKVVTGLAALEPQAEPSLRTQAACERRRARARPTACTRPRSASTDRERRSR